MLHRSAKFALLLFVALWASGAAQFVHERVDHDHAAANAAVAAAAKSHHSQWYSDSADPDEHNCAICATLATMTATGVATPVLLASHQPLVDRQPIVSERPVSRIDRRTPPARGPPDIA